MLEAAKSHCSSKRMATFELGIPAELEVTVLALLELAAKESGVSVAARAVP